MGLLTHRRTLARAPLVAAALVVALSLAVALTFALSLGLALTAACSTWEANPLYCDGVTRLCTDPALPRCDLVAHQCMPPDDAGVVPDGAVPDGPAPDGVLPDGPAPDGGCPVCPADTPICDPGTGTCRTCGAHAECLARDPTQPVCTAGTCHPNRCGDKYVDTAAGERCDDGNTDNGDGCDPTCRYTGTVTTVAGRAGGTGYCDALANDARFGDMAFSVVDDVRMFVSDSGSHTIRRITLPSFAVTTFAGAADTPGSADGAGAVARFNAPAGLARDTTYLYVADSGNYTIRRLTLADGTTTTIAGAAGQAGSADSPTSGLDARFGELGGLAIMSGRLYVADTGSCTLRMIDLSNSNFPVTTVAGVAGNCTHADGNATVARLNHPMGLATNGYNELFVADRENHVLRKLDNNGMMTTPCGGVGLQGSDDGLGSAARFAWPFGIALGQSGDLFVTDSNAVVRKVTTSTWSVATIAGSKGVQGSEDGVGTAALFAAPGGLAAGNDHLAYDLIVPDSMSLRRVRTTDGLVNTMAGAGSHHGSSDGLGAAARFDSPWGLSSWSDGVLITDRRSCTLRNFAVGDGAVETLAGTAGHCTLSDGTGALAGFGLPLGVTVSGTRVFVADRTALREFEPSSDGVVTRAGGALAGAQDGDGAAAGFTYLMTAASDGTFLYVSDNGTIRRIGLASPWTVTTILGEPGLWGSVDGTGPAARLGPYLGLQVVGPTVYVADGTSAAIRIVDVTTQPYSISTVAGSLGAGGTDDGVGAAARFVGPMSFAWDGQSLFVGDVSRVRQVEPATMRVTTLTGRTGCRSNIDGGWGYAAFNNIAALTYSPVTQSLFASDPEEDVIREIR
ncbi:MAG: hypothetical protein HY906_04135 [Deltaproteobacteria bacterium]|nr:hypothetical protein [Deltaproteobacteria bacterium]